MKWHHGIWGCLLLLTLAACGRRDDGGVVETRHGTSLPAVVPALQAIDSLMWRQPDSALAVMLDYFAGRDALNASPENDTDTTRRNHCVSTTDYDRHYAHLLISELLYKNDYEQSNREELQQAMAYFDSLCCRDAARYVSTDPILMFLDARAHYIYGVGFYEQGDVVNACAEYLKALETMEERFEKKELVGKKAQFMTYIYSRLSEMFSDQLLAESSITCYKEALSYCRREPTSKYGIPVLLYNLGIQYDVANQKDSAAFYYDEALANMPDFDNLHYRDLMTNKTIFAYYNMHYSSDSVIKSLKHLVALSADEEEKTTRLLTLGNILFEDKQYDSSRVYLETVFEQQEDNTSKLMAAEKLSSIYQMKGDSIKAQKYTSFLAGFTMSEIEKKKDVSKINEMFKDYLAQKQEKHAELEREKAVKKALEIIIPIAAVVALVIFFVAKRRNKKLLNEQQEEADRKLGETEQEHEKEMEAVRQTHQMEQAAMLGRLKQSNQELRELKDQIKQMDDLAAKGETAASFNEEPICRLIMERVNEGQFKAQMDCEIYKKYALGKEDLMALRLAADRHFDQFTARLKKAYPELTNSDLDYCCLYLLGLKDADIAALMQRAYNTINERSNKLKKVFGSNNSLASSLYAFANKLL